MSNEKEHEMELLEKKNSQALIESMRGEIAKANNELKCARQDLERVNQRLNLSSLIINELLTREETK